MQKDKFVDDMKKEREIAYGLMYLVSELSYDTLDIDYAQNTEEVEREVRALGKMMMRKMGIPHD